MRSPWLLAAAALAWLICARALSPNLVDTIVIGGLGFVSVAYALLRGGSKDKTNPVPTIGPDTDSVVSTAETAHQQPPTGASGALPPRSAIPTTATPERRDADPLLNLNVLTAAEVAHALRLDEAAVATAMSSGELPGNQLGGNWRCRESSVLLWLDGAWTKARNWPDDSC